MTPNADFLFSTETELLTSVLHNVRDVSGTLERFFQLMREAAPTLPAASGFFNPYGRLYPDCGHVELAACECDSPGMLVSMVERQMQLVTRVVAQLETEGRTLLLANNNHSGLLSDNCPIWGAHENYLVEQSPRAFGELILPFLVTRLYAGAGGILHPSGEFVAGVRHTRMDQATGGGTTESRAIHSTSRDEHHMGHAPNRWRYHLLLGDGHRSQWNLATQFACTALALKAIFHDDKLPRRIRMLGYRAESPWVALLRNHNRLAGPNRPLAIDPLVIDTQRVYLEAAKGYADKLGSRQPKWIAPILLGWEQMLDKMQESDFHWLAQRLDAFAKYFLYTAELANNGLTWDTLPGCEEKFNELALLDHSYHSFTRSDSVFRRLENSNLLNHRVVKDVAPGQEKTPFVPDTQTRARARANLICEHAGKTGVVVDWSWVHFSDGEKMYLLTDPFAKRYTKRRSGEETAALDEFATERLLASLRERRANR